ncbi:MAG: hydantoinase/oxoprolinase family protein [Acidobacteriota bacterium]
MSFKIGVDVGGTFIDLVVIDQSQNRRLYKTLSNPEDLGNAIIEGLNLAAVDQGMTLEEMFAKTEIIIHGSTVATNSLLTRNGARTALLTTAGFRDVLNMRRGLRENQYDPRQHPPVPLIPRQMIYPVEERMNCEGSALVAVNDDPLNGSIEKLRAAGIESVAIGLVFSFLNDSHERQLGATLRRLLPDVHISLSSEVLPEVRLYERISTTAVNAYVTPVLARYLEFLEAQLEEKGFAGKLLIMQSNGGVMSSDVGRQFGVRSILSGPAAGPVAGIHHGSLHGLADVITLDMGGTSCDVCLIKNGDIEITKDMEVAGHRIALPLVAVHTIGAGGGSLIRLDSRGLLQVGPESAGSSPGPVCYDRGGTQPTVTDADLVLGYLDSKRFWGGRLQLNEDAACEAIRLQVAQPLGLDPVRAAYGAYQVVNANMVDAIREVSVRRGYDPRSFLLVAAGGAGPIHAAAIARELEIPLVLVPREASVMCAAGQLLSDLRHDFVRSHLAPLEKLDFRTVNRLYGEMKDQATQTLRSEGISSRKMTLSFSADVRYIGQFSEVDVQLRAGSLTAAGAEELAHDFHVRHESLNGYSMPSDPLEVVNLRVVAKGITDKPREVSLPSRGTGSSDEALIGHRQAFFEDEFKEVPVYDGFQLSSGSTLRGPALVEQPTTTVVVQPDLQLTCDGLGNYMIYHKERSLEETISVLTTEVSDGS